MHRTCHAAATILNLKSEGNNEVSWLLNALKEEHQQWRQSQVVKKAEESEQIELLMKMKLGQEESKMTEEVPVFLNYPLVQVIDCFLGSRMNNWRAISLYISLMEKPSWGIYDGVRFLCAVDLCRTHAALGAERNLLGAEKSVGLYLAGVTFGGPEMHSVKHLLRLADE